MKKRKNEKISCKEAEKNIPDFLKYNLKMSDQIMFINHIDNCDECTEELAIQFLVSEGMSVLDGSDIYDIQSSFNKRLEHAHRQINIYRRLRYIVLFSFLLIVALVFSFAFFIL